jgi:hypothetical protein
MNSGDQSINDSDIYCCHIRDDIENFRDNVGFGTPGVDYGELVIKIKYDIERSDRWIHNYEYRMFSYVQIIIRESINNLNSQLYSLSIKCGAMEFGYKCETLDETLAIANACTRFLVTSERILVASFHKSNSLDS